MTTASTSRIALANLRYPPTPAASVALAEEAIGEAAAAGAVLVAFPECYVPGYRVPGTSPPPPDAAFLADAWAAARPRRTSDSSPTASSSPADRPPD
jgi:predicted amidohydrolase